VCYHSKLFHGAILDYPMYDKDLFAIVQVVKKWKHYLLGKETIIHMDHQPLQYLQSQSKMQQVRHYKWLGFLQQFHLLIKYKKGAMNKLANMLSWPPLKKIAIVGVIMQLEPFTHDLLSEDYEGDEYFRGVYKQLKERSVTSMEGNEYHLQDGMLYKLDKLCIP
jgi:hypothetical protein